MRHYPTIKTVAELKATLRAGAFTGQGGYPMYFLADDGEALSFAAVRDNLANVMAAIQAGVRDGWRVTACDVNWEDGELCCAHTGNRILSAYAELEEESHT